MTLEKNLTNIRKGIEYLTDSNDITYEINDEDNDVKFYDSNKDDFWLLSIFDIDTHGILWCIVYLSSYFKYGTYNYGDDE